MTPLLPAAAGFVALVAGLLILRTLGPRYRVGRLLATTPRVSIAEARAIAREGRLRYVRVVGRIDAEDDFEDADHRPLVFRRTRLEARSGQGWRTFDDHRQAVPFQVREGLDAVAVDGDALDAGLVVVPRESTGVAADLGERAPAGMSPATPVRMVIEQLSSVEHAVVLGLPRLGDAANGHDQAADREGATDAVMMTAGLGRPLVVSVLEQPEAMRVLAGGGGRARLAAACLAIGGGLLAVAAIWAIVSATAPSVRSAMAPGLETVAGAIAAIGDWLAPAAFAASAEATPATGGDPRSNGQGPGLVGAPGFAILVVAGIAIVTVLATTVYIRVTPARKAEIPDRQRDRPSRP